MEMWPIEPDQLTPTRLVNPELWYAKWRSDLTVLSTVLTSYDPVRDNFSCQGLKFQLHLLLPNRSIKVH